MARLGDFGAPPAEPDKVDTFGYFGEEIRVNAGFTDAELIDFLEAAQSVDENDPVAMLFLKDFMRQAVHADDFDRFWGLARENRQSLEDRMQVIYAIIGAVAGRPTKRPTGSSGGSQPTVQKSTGDSSSRVLERLEGRPDLQVVVLRAQEAVAS